MLLGAIFWLHTWLQMHALAVFDGEKWGFVSESRGGWRLFLDGWPVFVVIGLITAAGTFLLAAVVNDSVVEAAKAKAVEKGERDVAYRLEAAEDRAREAEALKEKAEERARNSLEYAETQAKAAYQERMSRIDQRERALRDAIAKAEAEAEESKNFRTAAQRQIEKSASCAIEQEKAKQAATAYSKRLKTSVLKAIEAAYNGDNGKLSRLYEKLKSEAEREAENPHETAENACLERAKQFFS